MRGKQLTRLASLVAVAALLLPGGRLSAQQDVPPTPAVSLPTLQSGSTPEGPLSSLAVLYDQMDHAGTGGIASQNYEPSYDSYDSQAADDFVVPAGIGYWRVSSVEVAGIYNIPSGATVHVSSVNVQFYAGFGTNLPKTLVYNSTIPVTSDSGGAFVINLSTPALFVPGTYWLSVQANMNFLPEYKQWLWLQRTVQSNNASAWRNPGNAYGKGCITWAPRLTTCGIGNAPDLLFRLNGTVIPGNPIPTVSQLTPSSVKASRAFTLIVDGANFVVGSRVGWNGNNRAATYVNSTRLQVAISASDVVTPNSTVSVTVFNPLPGGGRSGAKMLAITPNIYYIYLPFIKKQ